jgi:MFS family permease
LRWLLSASALSNLGDGISRIAFPLLAVTMTKDPVLIAGLAAIQRLPWLLFGALSGAMLDRTDRRVAMLAANATRAVVVGGLAVLVLLDRAGIVAVYVAALLVGTAETIADSAANVLVPAVVERDRLERANSKLQALEMVCQMFLGNPVGSVAFAMFAALPFLFTSGAYGIAAALLVVLAGSLAPRHRPVGTGTRLRAELAAGIRWLRGNALLVRLVALAAALALVMEFSQAQLVLYALQDLRLSEAAFGVFALAAGVGGIVGAAVAPRLARRFSRRAVMVGGSLTAGCATIGMGLIREPLLAALLLGLCGAAVIAINVVVATLRHLVIPDELLGRVLGVWRTVVWGAISVGAMIGGVLTTVLDSVARTFVVSGAGMAVIGVAAVFALRGFHLESDPAADG